jgi:2,5-diketo-D-gluconate reductase A
VGEFTALVLLAEIGDITRFGTARRLASWAGLTPTVRGSDLTVRHGHPSKQASLSVRWVLGQAAHIAKQHPESSMHTADQELMRERGVQIESWGPFAEGRNNLFTDPTLSQIAEAHGKSVAQVVLRWLVQREVVVIPKSVRADRMTQNLDIFDFTLTEDQMSQIATLDTGASLFFDHRDPAMVSWLGGRRID